MLLTLQALAVNKEQYILQKLNFQSRWWSLLMEKEEA